MLAILYRFKHVDRVRRNFVSRLGVHACEALRLQLLGRRRFHVLHAPLIHLLAAYNADVARVRRPAEVTFIPILLLAVVRQLNLLISLRRANPHIVTARKHTPLAVGRFPVILARRLLWFRRQVHFGRQRVPRLFKFRLVRKRLTLAGRTIHQHPFAAIAQPVLVPEMRSSQPLRRNPLLEHLPADLPAQRVGPLVIRFRSLPLRRLPQRAHRDPKKKPIHERPQCSANEQASQGPRRSAIRSCTCILFSIAAKPNSSVAP